MKLNFDNKALEWLKENGFNEDDNGKLLELLKAMKKNRENGEVFITPKSLNPKVSAILTALNLMDSDGKMVWSKEETTINIPEESKRRFSSALELEEFEGEVTTLKSNDNPRKILKPRRKQA